MPDLADRSAVIRVGHKGADSIVPGNTVESFEKAVETGVDVIELDVLWLQDAHLPIEQRAPLVVAHDWADAARRTPLTLTEALDAFLEPPLDQVEIDLDVKLPGREEEIVAALRERDLVERAMVSTMELYSLGRILELEPKLRRGWTYPKVTKDWTSRRWAKAPMLAAMVGMRYRLPGQAAQQLPRMGVSTVDDEDRMRELVAAGVTGICSNDPRLFSRLLS